MIVLSFLCLGCGGSDEPAAASDTSGAEATPAITSVVTDVWLVVRAVEGRGLAVGSGVRFHASAFDVVSRGQANTFSLTCPAEGTWVCEGPGGSIQLEVIDGALRVTQPGLVLTLDAASEAQSTHNKRRVGGRRTVASRSTTQDTDVISPPCSAIAPARRAMQASRRSRPAWRASSSKHRKRAGSAHSSGGISAGSGSRSPVVWRPSASSGKARDVFSPVR
jgi:hypothetical protein